MSAAATAVELRATVGRLAEQRRCALAAGLGANRRYMRELNDELQAAQAAYVGFAVPGLASLRAALSTLLLG